MNSEVLKVCQKNNLLLSVNEWNLIVGSKLFVWHTLEISEFILILHGANYKLGKPQGLILHFS
jgi:hypothetical protein